MCARFPGCKPDKLRVALEIGNLSAAAAGSNLQDAIAQSTITQCCRIGRNDTPYVAYGIRLSKAGSIDAHGEASGFVAARIYFIGGQSASGKSTTAAEVASDYGLNVVKLDDYYNVLREHGLTEDALEAATSEVARRIIIELINSQAQCIVEGAWLGPNHAAILRTQAGFHPVYFGYPNADPQQRLAQIWANSRNGSGHWLCSKNADEAIEILTRCVAVGEDLRKHCERLQLDFFDCSDFDRGMAQVKDHFATIWRNGDDRRRWQ
jgi:predicted kinase